MYGTRYLTGGHAELVPACCALLLGLLMLVSGAREVSAQEDTHSMILVAKPALSDPNFARTVVLVTRHGRAGTVGIILNRPTDATLAHMFPENKLFEKSTDPVYQGGPVALRTPVFLFRSSTPVNNALHLFADVYLSADLSVLTNIYQHTSGTNDLRVFAGHAGWYPGQLRQEIIRGDWHITEADTATVFHADAETLWPRFITLFNNEVVQAVRSYKQPPHYFRFVVDTADR